MSSRNWVLVIALTALVLVWPVAGAVTAADAGGDSALGGLAHSLGVAGSDGATSDAATAQFDTEKLNVSYDEAHTTAREQLSDPETHSLTEASIGPDNYEFEFVYQNGSDSERVAVEVDGDHGNVVSVDRESHPGNPNDELVAIEVVEGTPAPGAELTLQLSVNDDPLAGTRVELNDDVVGETDENGQISLTLANSSESKIKVKADDAEGELEFEFESESEDDDEADSERALTVGIVDGTLSPGESVTVEVTDGSETVEGATVAVNDESAGTTGQDGTLSFALPEDDEIELEIEYEDSDTELEFEFDDEGDEGDEQGEDDEDTEDRGKDDEDRGNGENSDDDEDDEEDDDDRGNGENSDDEEDDEEDDDDRGNGENSDDEEDDEEGDEEDDDDEDDDDEEDEGEDE